MSGNSINPKPPERTFTFPLESSEIGKGLAITSKGIAISSSWAGRTVSYTPATSGKLNARSILNYLKAANPQRWNDEITWWDTIKFRFSVLSSTETDLKILDILHNELQDKELIDKDIVSPGVEATNRAREAFTNWLSNDLNQESLANYINDTTQTHPDFSQEKNTTQSHPDLDKIWQAKNPQELEKALLDGVNNYVDSNKTPNLKKSDLKQIKTKIHEFCNQALTPNQSSTSPTAVNAAAAGGSVGTFLTFANKEETQILQMAYYLTQLLKLDPSQALEAANKYKVEKGNIVDTIKNTKVVIQDPAGAAIGKSEDPSTLARRNEVGGLSKKIYRNVKNLLSISDIKDGESEFNRSTDPKASRVLHTHSYTFFEDPRETRNLFQATTCIKETYQNAIKKFLDEAPTGTDTLNLCAVSGDIFAGKFKNKDLGHLHPSITQVALTAAIVEILKDEKHATKLEGKKINLYYSKHDTKAENIAAAATDTHKELKKELAQNISLQQQQQQQLEAELVSHFHEDCLELLQETIPKDDENDPNFVQNILKSIGSPTTPKDLYDQLKALVPAKTRYPDDFVEKLDFLLEKNYSLRSDSQKESATPYGTSLGDRVFLTDFLYSSPLQTTSVTAAASESHAPIHNITAAGAAAAAAGDLREEGDSPSSDQEDLDISPSFSTSEEQQQQQQQPITASAAPSLLQPQQQRFNSKTAYGFDADDMKKHYSLHMKGENPNANAFIDHFFKLIDDTLNNEERGATEKERIFFIRNLMNRLEDTLEEQSSNMDPALKASVLHDLQQALRSTIASVGPEQQKAACGITPNVQ